MPRPFFFEGIERLEALVADPNTPQSLLDAIASELTFRNTFRARRLAKKLQSRTAQKPMQLVDDVSSGVPDNASIRISTLPLSTRARNVLSSLQVVLVADLCRISEAELLRTPNAGRKTLNELRSVLRSLGLRFGMNFSSDGPNASASAQIELPIELRIEEPSDLAGALRAHVEGATPSKRNAQWVIEHLGWDGQPHRTLEAIGAAATVTRERVRQVVAKCTLQLRARETVPLALKRALEIIKKNAPLTQSTLDRLLTEEGLVSEQFHVDGIRRAADVFGVAFPFSTRDGSDTLIFDQSDAELPKRLLQHAKAEVAAHGAVVDDQLLEIGREITGRRIDTAFAHAVLRSDGSYRQLPDCSEWWWRPRNASRGRNRLVNTITKVLAACPAIRIAELREACRRHIKSDHIAPPTRVVRAICTSLPHLRVEGDLVERSAHTFPWNDVLNESERLLLAIFERRGPVLDSYTVSEEGIALGINENSLTIYKTYSPLLWRPAPGCYSIVGAEIPVGLMEELDRARARPMQTTLGFGWTADHRLLLAKRVTEGLWLSGILNLPSSLAKFISGEFTIHAFGRHELGSINVRQGNAFGFKPFLRMFGADLGDVLVVAFNPRNMRCDSWLGGAELLGLAKIGPDAVMTYVAPSNKEERVAGNAD